MNYVEFLKDEIAVLRTKLRPQATGHIYTAIKVLEDRIEELEKPRAPELIVSKLIMDKMDYKLQLTVSKNISPKGIYSINMIQRQFKDGSEIDRSTYNFHLDNIGISNLIDGLNSILENGDTKDRRTEYRVQANSPYNDGYTQDFYRKELDSLNTLYEST